jgi:hypothetical protein
VLPLAYIDQLKSLDGEGALVTLRNTLFCDIVGGIEVGRFDIETDAIGSHAGEYVIDLVAHDMLEIQAQDRLQASRKAIASSGDCWRVMMRF